ncbi:vitellogenin-like, partial [Ruditapes philippinarum]|uniref:vitellogenin-like n=1 Tax=Ruditapes philippinarum TaxID=129788 RepID=UPI00295C0F42
MGLSLIFTFLLVTGTFASPIQEVGSTNQCANQCTVTSQFRYESGKTYEYRYETEIRTAIQGASEDQAGVDMSAKVYIDFLSKCEMVIRMSDVKMLEHDPETSTMKPMTTELISELERNPLIVSFQDGKIEELCLSKPESDKILNIKRGILSLIQNNMDDINKDQTVTE